MCLPDWREASSEVSWMHACEMRRSFALCNLSRENVLVSPLVLCMCHFVTYIILWGFVTR